MSRYRRGPNGPARLALELSGAGIRLMERGPSGGWKVLGTAPLDGDFSDRIDALRVEALVRGPGPVDLWLPADQLLVRRYELRRGVRGRAEALRRLSAETGRRQDEFCITICPAPAGEPATVVGALAGTVAEARDYAGRWGFRPGRVAFRPDAVPFGASAPGFERPRRLFPPALPAGRGLMATVAAAAVLLGFAGWGVWQLAPGDEPPAIVSEAAPVLALARVEAARPDLPRAPVSEVRRVRAQSMPAQPPRPGQAAAAVIGAGPAAAPAPGRATELAQPSPGVRMHVGPGPGLPRRSHPARLDSVATVTDRLDPVKFVSAMDRLRDETALRTASKPLTMAAVTVLAPEPRPAADAEGAAEAEGSGPADRVQAPAISAAPRHVPEAPPPRPEPEPKADTGEPEPEATGGEAPSALAVLAAPSPPAKPEQMARRVASAASLRAFGGDPSPSNVQQAAREHGLELDSTSLIGVLDARSGRQALLRTSAGEFLKVARGDSVEGWRVSAINREAVRLTRGGQSRTLLLMVR